MLRVGTDENAALEGPSAGDGAHLLDAFEAYGETGLARFSRFEIMLLFDFLCLSEVLTKFKISRVEMEN